LIELTEEQAQALAEQESPLQVVNPRNQETYVLVCKDVYDLVCRIVSVPNPNGWDDPGDDDLIRKRPGNAEKLPRSTGRTRNCRGRRSAGLSSSRPTP